MEIAAGMAMEMGMVLEMAVEIVMLMTRPRDGKSNNGDVGDGHGYSDGDGHRVVSRDI